jgi:hypothetical protein
MKILKQVLIILFFALISKNINAQVVEENQSFTYAEFRGGYGLTIFGKGLKERVNKGNFSNSGGGLACLAAYHKFKKINYLNFGLKYKSLGAAPARGDSMQELFFNYWGAAVGIKYFPFNKQAKKGIYIQADYFFVTQFTMKYRTTSNLNFDHQFAIGNGYAFGIGYDIPLGNRKTMITIGIEYEYDKRRGEVTGIGDKTFISSNFGVLTGIKF